MNIEKICFDAKNSYILNYTYNNLDIEKVKRKKDMVDRLFICQYSIKNYFCLRNNFDKTFLYSVL